MSRPLLPPLFLMATLASVARAQFCPCPCPPPVVFCPPVVVSPVVPCAPTTGMVNPRTPTIVPERMQSDPVKEPKKEARSEPLGQPREFATPTAAESKPDVKAEPKPPVTPAAGTGEKLPPIAVPMTPGPKPAADPLPSFDLPIPNGDADKPADKPRSPAPLPKLDIPLPDAPAQPVEANKREARSSPLAAERERSVDVYPVDGPAPASPAAKRTIGFVNKTGGDVLLTIDGRLTTLPARNVLRADLPASFKWQIGGEAERVLTVPTTAPGVDVIIRR